MSVLTYESLKHKPDTLKAMTSLTRSEFDELLIVFAKTWDEVTGQASRNPSQGGRPPRLNNAADRLLFILFYLKTYPLQEVIAHLFDLSQGQANFLIHQLSEVLRKTLRTQRVSPDRIPPDMMARLHDEAAQDYGIDGTERNIQRPLNPIGQTNHYSGKKKPIP
jgi:hypothetical protein